MRARRDVVIKLRVTKQERDVARRIAKAWGVSVSDVIRLLLRNKVSPPWLTLPDDAR